MVSQAFQQVTSDSLLYELHICEDLPDMLCGLCKVVFDHYSGAREHDKVWWSALRNLFSLDQSSESKEEASL